MYLISLGNRRLKMASCWLFGEMPVQKLNGALEMRTGQGQPQFEKDNQRLRGYTGNFV